MIYMAGLNKIVAELDKNTFCKCAHIYIGLPHYYPGQNHEKTIKVNIKA